MGVAMRERMAQWLGHSVGQSVETYEAVSFDPSCKWIDPNEMVMFTGMHSLPKPKLKLKPKITIRKKKVDP